MKLLTTGYLQVIFVTLQTWFISREMLIPIFIGGFLISFIWSFNVKRVAFGNMRDRMLYSSGAALGAFSGILLAKLF